MSKRQREAGEARGGQRPAGQSGARGLDQRLALRPQEAAEALGISERTLRQLLPELPHVRLGRAVVLPVAELRAWLRERSRAEAGKAGAIAEALADSLR